MMDMEMRIAARRFTEGNENKPREAILGALVANDVKRLLNEGRDWRYEFRHGDDYVEWVAALPSNPDKSAAINSIMWATRELDPEKAAELNQRFYPKKP